MIRLPILSTVLLATIAACTTAAPPPEPLGQTIITGERPLQVLPAEADLVLVREDLLATARDRFGQAALDQALAAPAHLIAKRFAGMLPPPPPGEPTRPAPTPTALLMKSRSGWMVATESGWRAAKPDSAAEINRVLADPAFWAESPYTPPCPDYGAGLLLAKMPGKAEAVRKSMCMSVSEKAVSAALSA